MQRIEPNDPRYIALATSLAAHVSHILSHAVGQAGVSNDSIAWHEEAMMMALIDGAATLAVNRRIPIDVAARQLYEVYQVRLVEIEAIRKGGPHA